jgi:ABC-type sugar transport system permease subunit
MFRYITFPLIKNMIFTCLILIANYTLKSFDFAFQTTSEGPVPLQN